MRVLRGPGNPVAESDHQWLEPIKKENLRKGDLVTWGSCQTYCEYLPAMEHTVVGEIFKVPPEYNARFDGLENCRKENDSVKSGDKQWLEKVAVADLSPDDLITWGNHNEYRRVRTRRDYASYAKILRVPAFMDAGKSLGERFAAETLKKSAAREQIFPSDKYRKDHDKFLERVEGRDLARGDLITWGMKEVYQNYNPERHHVVTAWRVPPEHGGQPRSAPEKTAAGDVVGKVMKLRECKPGWTVEYIDDGDTHHSLIGRQRTIKLITEDMVYLTNGAVVQGGYRRSVRVVATTPQAPEKQEKMSTEDFQKAMGGLAAMQSGGETCPDVQTLGTSRFIVPRELILQKLREVEGMPKDIILEDFYVTIPVQSSEFKHHNPDHLLGIEETENGWAVEGTHVKKVDPAVAFRQ